MWRVSDFSYPMCVCVYSSEASSGERMPPSWKSEAAMEERRALSP